MDKKTVNRQIRSISNRSSLLLLVFFALVIPAQILLKYMSRTGGYDSVWQDSKEAEPVRSLASMRSKASA